MTYQEAVDYIEEIPKFTKKHTLEHTREFLRGLGNPEKDQKIIHVAGTNGKGSVCAYLRAMLEADGKTTGFFTSPHLVKINERICLNGQPVSDEEFLRAFEKVKTTVDEMSGAGFAHPSYFEFLFGMGMVVFAEKHPDYTILETGLGGRLDATNAVGKPLMTVITSISLYHTKYLGNTISEIAAEKAGIIKEGTPVIFDGNDEAAAEIIQNTAKEHHAPCREIGKNAFEIREVTRKHIAFSRTNAYHKDVIWQVPICGIYQVKNAEIAIEAAQCLLGNKPEHEEMWRDAVAKIQWQGRMEECADHFIIDGAHNPGAIEAFVESVRALKEEEPPILIFSAVSDKKYEQMIEYLCRHLQTKAFVVTEIEDKRRVPAGELGEIFKRYATCPVYVKADVKDAIACAYEMRTKETYIYCIGSLYLAGMVEKALQEVETSC